ncbi:MAG: DUF362 domain-containing protein [Anaerolineales bacterium]|nr:DUF362 domain-containing protein [Anaerolineales bacterium]
MRSINRRGFLRMTGVWGKAAGLSLFLKACAKVGIPTPPVDSPIETQEPFLTEKIPTTESLLESQTPTPGPSTMPASTLTPDPGRIALVKTMDRGAGVRQAIDLLGIHPIKNKRVFLKPNYNSADPAPGSTHADVLRSLASWLVESEAQSITLGERSGMGDTRQVLQQLGVFDIADEFSMTVIVLDDLAADGWVKFAPQGSHWQRGFIFPRACLEADIIVQACCLKTHQYGGYFTMSLKNSVGLVAKYDPVDGYNYMTELHSSGDQRKMIAEINTVYQPALIVMDGVEAFVSGGPAVGKTVQPGVILAGADRIAIDAVGVAILRYYGTTPQVSEGKIFEQEQITRAVELRLGVDSPEKISFVTGDESSAGFAEELKPLLI